MAIESAAHLRQLARTGLLVLAGMATFLGAAMAQQFAPPPVTTGSVIPLQHSTSWGQIYTIRIAPTGDVVFLDVSQSGLYQLKAGSTTFTTIASGSPLSPASSFWNEGLAMDAKGTIYIGQRYPGGANQMLRVPYNPADGTWDISANDTFATNILVNGQQMSSTELAFLDSPAKDGSGTLYVASQTGNSIYAVPVNADGSVPLDGSGNPQIQTIVYDLKTTAAKIAIDANGNIYFIEAPQVAPSARIQGIFFVPASIYKGVNCGTTASPQAAQAGCIIGDAAGAAEAQLTRIDPASNPEKYDGISLDPAGNIYLTDESDGYGGTINGVYILPNESGSPIGVTASSFNWNDLRYIAPIQSNASLTVDPRGFLWIPTSTSGWTPNGENAVPGTDNFVLWALGSANLGASPVGTVSPTGTVYYNFSSSVTPTSIGFSTQGGSNFSLVTTDPNPNTTAATPAAPCTIGTTYAAISSCPVWLATNPTLPGSVAGELSMLDSNNNVIGGSTTSVYGVGQGPAVSLLVPSMQTPIATGLVTPEQVATDSLGNSYVADSGQGKVLKFAAGSTAASAGTAIGTGLTAPTGVAVDGKGDVYIADSGKVIEVPVNLDGTLNAAGQTVLQSGLGTNLKLAVDGADNIYVADPDNARVVRIPNSPFSITGLTLVPVGSGFAKPSAVAVDNSGDIFVADGTTLSEITATFGGQTAITKSLATPVTGLAVDPSGSVDVAQSGGVIRIPLEDGVYDASSEAAIDQDAVTAPNGVALDPSGNMYVSDVSNGTPNLFELSLNAYGDFGQVGPFVTTDPMDIDVFNIGNEPLSLTAVPTIASTDGSDGEFALTPATQNPCDTSGQTSVSPGSDCTLDVTLTAAGLGARTGTMTVATNAINAPSVVANLIGTGSGNLAYTTTTFTLSPVSGITYPGATTAAVTIVPTSPDTAPAGAMPTGTVTLTLTPQGKGGQTFTFSGPVTPGATSSTASIPAINLSGGTYSVKATYKGDTNFFGGSGTPVILTVAQASPTSILSEPNAISPINGVYYVGLGANTTLQASVISPLGTPTGTVAFMNGSTVADPTQNPVALDAAGEATFSTANLPAGTYNLTAISNSTNTDPNFASVASPAVTFQVIPPSVLISAAPASISTTAGTPVQSMLTVQDLVGYGVLGLQIQCVNATLPQYSECTFNNPSLNMLTNTVATTVVTISTNVPVNVGAVRTKASPVAFAGMFGLGLLGLVLRRKGKFNRSALSAVFLMLVFAGVVVGFAGCTNSGYTHTPPPIHVVTPSGTFQVSIVGTDPTTGATKSLPFTLTLTVK